MGAGDTEGADDLVGFIEGAAEGVTVGLLVGGMVGAGLGGAVKGNVGMAVGFAVTGTEVPVPGVGGDVCGALDCPKVDVALENNIRSISIIVFGFVMFFRDLTCPEKSKSRSWQKRPIRTSEGK